MSSDAPDSTLSGSYAYTDTLKGVYYGPGCLTVALPKLLATLGATKALVVTGRSLHEKTDVVRRVEDILRERGAYGATYWEIGEHSPVAGIKAGAQALARAGADIVVSVGGGSPVDAAKAMIHISHAESGDSNARFLPHIAVPTTLSAAEYTASAGFTDEAGNKVLVTAPELAPAGIILDAELTLPTPERLWLSTGLRALDHAVESLYRPGVPHPVKVLCYAAIAELFTYLPLSKAHPTDVAVRQRLQVAAWMSLWPLKFEIRTGLGLSHSLGHKLGAKYHISHGITSCLTLSPVVALQSRIASSADKRSLAGALAALHIPSSGTPEADILRLSSEIDKLVTQLGLKTDLAACGVPVEDLSMIAEQALGSRDDARFPAVCGLLEGLYPIS
ncbi:alcohol dehydrogenase IV [Phellopilus nigrolimitatus]|nr:alcohol dehydrogenase IV [Phellopilus nigrolimitatus]